MRRRYPIRVSWLFASLLVVLAFFAMAGPAAVAKQPIGNNGTVKIHDGATDTEPYVRNEPHVGAFHLHFYFADPAQTGDWEIRAWAPGDKGAVVLNGSYDTSPNGSDRQPATGAYTLPDGHYKLFWDGRNGHNVKHKTFWVQGGVAPTGTVSPTGSVAPTQTTKPTGSVEATTGSRTLPPTDSQPTGGARVGGSVLTVLGILIAVSGLAVLTTSRAAVTRR